MKLRATWAHVYRLGEPPRLRGDAVLVCDSAVLTRILLQAARLRVVGRASGAAKGGGS